MGGSSVAAFAKVAGACLIVAVLLPLSILSALVRKLSGGRTPSVVSLLDGPVFTPYELRRVKHEHVVDETHGFWKRVGDRVAVNPKRTFTGAIAVLLVMCLGLFFFSTDLTTNDSYREKVESIEGQELLAKSFPAGSERADGHHRRACGGRGKGLRGRRGRRRRADRESPGGGGRERPDLDPGDARPAAVLHRGVRADRADPRRGRRRRARRRRDRGGVRRARSGRLGLAGDPADRAARRVPDPDAAAARGDRPARADRDRDPVLRGRARRLVLHVRRRLRLRGL